MGGRTKRKQLAKLGNLTQNWGDKTEEREKTVETIETVKTVKAVNAIYLVQ